MPVVHISLIKGRSKEAKKAIAQEVTESVHKHSGAPKEAITVVFHDIDGDSWASAGVLFSDRVKK
ncbi:MAG: tautomerase family protein [Candidatus Tectomicrobia bacterium]|uniref:Tautomerase family protein n=1 Tax=Tectimicrobiota bacterium TaxID=2528274 RepID=A0A932I3M7_UNCTE|nr:tautomerase family protein [Candidatus Tectomicrobia bacterium]